MIPPLKPMRLRSINRWLSEQETLPSAEQASKAESLDEQMMETFEMEEDRVKDAMMKAGTWGTGEGMNQFPMARVTLWGVIVAEYLPTTDQDSET